MDFIRRFDMKIKVYNEDGIVKITKIITLDNYEKTVFSNLQDGEVAEIEVDYCVNTKATKGSISR